jgi:hypothetical protein
MTRKNILPHFVIQESDVDKIKNSPTGRTKIVPRIFSEHGQRLSLGIQQVEEFTILNPSSLDDVVVVRPKLHEGHKFSEQSKQDFLKSRDIEVKAIQTNEVAVVATMPQAVQKFKQYVGTYAKNGTNKTDLQYVEEITPFHGVDKIRPGCNFSLPKK